MRDTDYNDILKPNETTPSFIWKDTPSKL